MANMEFWGVEVKAGEPVKCKAGTDRKYIHISQMSLGEIKKDEPSVSAPIFATVDDKKFVVGHLSTDRYPQISLDLVFEKDFELSHGWKNGSVYICGYQSTFDEMDSDFSEPESDEEIPIVTRENGKPDPPKPLANKPKAEKAVVESGKPKPKVEVPKNLAKPEVDDEDDEDDDDDDDDEDDEDDDMDEDDEDDDDEDDEDESEDEETPVKTEKGKKRTQDSATKTPGPEKKVKLDTPEGGQKTGKKIGHTATPYPTKQAGKAPGDKAKQQQTPNSTAKKAEVLCKTCSKNFGSSQALESHTKAKHSVAAK